MATIVDVRPFNVHPRGAHRRFAGVVTAALVLLVAGGATGAAAQDDSDSELSNGDAFSTSCRDPANANRTWTPDTSLQPPASTADSVVGLSTPASSSDDGDDPVALWLATGLILSLLGIGGTIGPYMGRSGDAPKPPPPIPDMPPLPDASTIPRGPATESNVEFLDHLVRDEVIDHLNHPPPTAPQQGPPTGPPPATLDVVGAVLDRMAASLRF